jgi:hypothetical protein
LSTACKYVCNTNYADCNLSGTDGCEINVQTDKNNCGACGKVCASGETCVSGRCASVLFIDDDGGANNDAQWRATLDSLGIAYASETLSVDGQPTTSLTPFKTVIWSIGDRAYTNLTAANASALAAYLDAGGGLVYGGGHALYSEPQAAAFVASYLGVKNYNANMPSFASSGSPAYADGTGGVFGTTAYTLRTFSGGTYGGSMLSAFAPNVPTATGQLKHRVTNLSLSGSVDYSTELVGVLNKTGVYRALTIGIDIHHVDSTPRATFVTALINAVK